MSRSTALSAIALMVATLTIPSGSRAQQVATPGSPETIEPIRGFPESAWAAQHALESRAHAIPTAARLREYMDRVASEPHHAGSPGSLRVAEMLATQLRDWGLDTRIETFEALLPYPTLRRLEMTAPVPFTASLAEPPLEDDPDSAHDDRLPTFNAYSASGDVTGELVYVNYGLPEDYKLLETQGIDVAGKIVIVRYGQSWRGLKPLLAEQHGAIACLIYSDPQDDGFFSGLAYPAGPTRPPYGVQRGSVIGMPVYPGDPLSPGWASEPGSDRLTREEADTLLHIPVMPISWADAEPLMAELRGPMAPESWRGRLPLPYHIGPGPATVHLAVDFDWATRPLYNVIATIPGSVHPDQWILYGNHHDAWVHGASDPVSGVSVLMETARTLAELRKQGWQPERTIKLALWDGEEFGLVGSTEWVEKHIDELTQKAAVYLNTDSSGAGPFTAAGSHALGPFLNEVLRDVTDPKGGSNLRDAATLAQFPGAELPATGGTLPLGSLGAGSDYVAFLHHSGIASLNMGFGAPGGQYHSTYDSVRFFNNYSDPDRSHSIALTQVQTTMLLRLAGAAYLPFEFNALASNLRTYVDEIAKGVRRTQQTELDLSAVSQQVIALTASARNFEDALAAALSAAPIDQTQRERANEAILMVERALILPAGLPRRPWYRHQLYAPGLLTGYSAKTLPGVREAVEASDWAEASTQAARLTATLRAANAAVQAATQLLRSE